MTWRRSDCRRGIITQTHAFRSALARISLCGMLRLDADGTRTHAGNAVVTDDKTKYRCSTCRKRIAAVEHKLCPPALVSRETPEWAAWAGCG